MGERHRYEQGHTTFLGYRIYRKRFLGTAAVVLLLSIAVFSGMLIFFMNTWMSELQEQSQIRFWEGERRLANIQSWTMDYINGLYESTRLMDDVKALFSAADEAQYLRERMRNSLGSPQQVRYFPADIKKLFTGNRSRVSGVTLRSMSGMKAIWLERSGDICLSFGYDDLSDVRQLDGFDGILAASCSVRDLQHMNQTIGIIDFWVDCEDIYEKDENFSADWALLEKDGRMFYDSGLDGRQSLWVELAAREQEQNGWLSDRDGTRFFYVKFTSDQGGYTYVVVKDTASAMRDNLYMLIALLAALVLLDAGVLSSSYVSILADANFLTTIMTMLSDMEGGAFEKIQKMELPVRHRENEYGMIAVALKDVGMKLSGYIETEYILKLKEQETQMRALQHQINPHFLYNTLETLRSKALMQGDRDMADAIAMLGALYRARMHKKESVLLKEEFELLEMYLKIMALRYGDRFVYQTELDPEIENMKTVTFWLQPLAENFFTHGFDRESEYNLLIVSGHAENGGARIEVLDNGAGADPERLPAIRQSMYEGNDDPEADIGLRNVYMRLHYFYRDGFEMDIDNNAEGGFCISIFIPLHAAGSSLETPSKLIPGKVGENVHVGDRG